MIKHSHTNGDRIREDWKLAKTFGLYLSFCWMANFRAEITKCGSSICSLKKALELSKKKKKKVLHFESSSFRYNIDMQKYKAESKYANCNDKNLLKFKKDITESMSFVHELY